MLMNSCHTILRIKIKRFKISLSVFKELFGSLVTTLKHVHIYIVFIVLVYMATFTVAYLLLIIC